MDYHKKKCEETREKCMQTKKAWNGELNTKRNCGIKNHSK